MKKFLIFINFCIYNHLIKNFINKMTSIVNIFQECLNSNLNCKEIYDKISKFSIYELNKYIKEKDVYNEFIKYFQLNFNDEFLYI